MEQQRTPGLRPGEASRPTSAHSWSQMTILRHLPRTTQSPAGVPMRARGQSHFGCILRHWSRARKGAPAGDCVVRGKWRRIDRVDLPCAEVGLEASPGRRPGVRCCSIARQSHSGRHYSGGATRRRVRAGLRGGSARGFVRRGREFARECTAYRVRRAARRREWSVRRPARGLSCRV